MADWVHCNTCFRQPWDGRKFSLTNCGHIYCEECVRPGSQMVCKMCKANCTTILLSSKMKPELELYFTDPVELMKKHHKQLVQVMEFQKNHRQRLTAWIRERMSKQNSVVAKAQKYVQQFQEYEKEMKLLKEENSYLKKLVEKQTSGPGRTSPMAISSVRTVGGSPVGSQNIRTSPSPTRYDVSPRAQTKRSPFGQGNSISQIAKPPYEMPAVTTGRVLVKTPPQHISMSGIPRTPSPYVGMSAPVPPQTNMPITPVSYGHSMISGMDISRSQSSSYCGSGNQHLTPGSGSKSLSHVQVSSYPSRLR